MERSTRRGKSCALDGWSGKMPALPRPEINSMLSETPSTMPYARQNRKTGMISYKVQKERRYSRQYGTPNRGEPIRLQTSYMERNEHKPSWRKLSCSAQPSSPNHRLQTYREKTSPLPADYHGPGLPTRRYGMQSGPHHPAKPPDRTGLDSNV